MAKQFECSLTRAGNIGGSIVVLKIGVMEGETKEEVELKAKKWLFEAEWRTKKYLEEGVSLEVRELEEGT